MSETLFNQVDRLQRKMYETSTELDKQKVRFTNDDKTIKITVSGQMEILKLKIDHEAFADKPDELEAELINVFNQARIKAQELAAEKLRDIPKNFGSQ